MCSQPTARGRFTRKRSGAVRVALLGRYDDGSQADGEGRSSGPPWVLCARGVCGGDAGDTLLVRTGASTPSRRLVRGSKSGACPRPDASSRPHHPRPAPRPRSLPFPRSLSLPPAPSRAPGYPPSLPPLSPLPDCDCHGCWAHRVRTKARAGGRRGNARFSRHGVSQEVQVWGIGVIHVHFDGMMACACVGSL